MTKQLTEARNFTAVLPLDCDSACSFCPESSMKSKAPFDTWLEGLVLAINTAGKDFDHVSLTGGEPTMDMDMLFTTVDTIRKDTHIKHVGLTTNGHMLLTAKKTLNFLGNTFDSDYQNKLSFINISRHSFDDELNAKILQRTKRIYSMEDLTRFRRILGEISFHINFVICAENYDRMWGEMRRAKELMEKYKGIDVVFRIDYSMTEIVEGLRTSIDSPSDYPDIRVLFESVFNGASVATEEDFANSCASCFTLSSKPVGNNRAWLKASEFEPNDVEEGYTEMVYHMDGNLYYDWSRNTPVPAWGSLLKKVTKAAMRKAIKEGKDMEAEAYPSLLSHIDDDYNERNCLPESYFASYSIDTVRNTLKSLTAGEMDFGGFKPIENMTICDLTAAINVVLFQIHDMDYNNAEEVMVEMIDSMLALDGIRGLDLLLFWLETHDASNLGKVCIFKYLINRTREFDRDAVIKVLETCRVKHSAAFEHMRERKLRGLVDTFVTRVEAEYAESLEDDEEFDDEDDEDVEDVDGEDELDEDGDDETFDRDRVITRLVSSKVISRSKAVKLSNDDLVELLEDFEEEDEDDEEEDWDEEDWDGDVDDATDVHYSGAVRIAL